MGKTEWKHSKVEDEKPKWVWGYVIKGKLTKRGWEMQKASEVNMKVGKGN